MIWPFSELTGHILAGLCLLVSAGCFYKAWKRVRDYPTEIGRPPHMRE